MSEQKRDVVLVLVALCHRLTGKEWADARRRMCENQVILSQRSS